MRWPFVNSNKSQASFREMLNFLVILMVLKHPNQWAVIKLCVKKELIKEMLVMLVMFC